MSAQTLTLPAGPRPVPAPPATPLVGTCPTSRDRYLAWSGANRVAEQMRESGERADATPYPCPICDGIHIGGAGRRRDTDTERVS